MHRQQPRIAPVRARATRHVRSGLPFGVVTVSAYLLTLLLFLFYSGEIYTVTHRLLAWLVFVAASLPIVRFIARPVGVPLLQFVNIQFIVLFVLPLFHETRLSTATEYRIPSEQAITLALACTLMAVLSIGAGYRFAARTIRLKLSLLSFPASELRLFFLGVVLSLGSLVLFSGAFEIPPSIMQPLIVLISLDLGLVLLALLYYQGSLRPWQRNVARAVFAGSIGAGLIGGSSQAVLQPVLILLTCKWVTIRKGPTRSILFLAVAFFMLQPVKNLYRAQVWYGGHTFTAFEKATLYVELIGTYWSKVLTSPDAVTEQVKSSASERLSLLLSTAHYVELTPSQVDYKNGSTLAYMLYGWVPRFLWPGKPTAQVANKVMPVEYGLQTEQGAKTAMFGVGSVAEAYANFGMVGVIPLFFIIGMLYQMPVLLLGSARSVTEYAVVIAAVMNVMWIGSTISHAFGGVLQQVLTQAILLRAITMVRTPRMSMHPVSARRDGVATAKRSTVR